MRVENPWRKLPHGENSDESILTSAMYDVGYKTIKRTEYLLPNEKIFIRLDYTNV